MGRRSNSCRRQGLSPSTRRAVAGNQNFGEVQPEGSRSEARRDATGQWWQSLVYLSDHRSRHAETATARRRGKDGRMSNYSLPNINHDLSGQVALVTGGTSGLGWRFTQVLADAGAIVVPTGRRKERLTEIARLVEASGGNAHPIVMDTTNAESIISGVAEAEEVCGTVTIAVNNAGVPDAQRAHKMSIELIDTVLDTNLRGPWILACEVARRLIAAEKPGRIVNIASVAAFNYAGQGAALYSVSKAAIARMSEVLAVEWSRFGINVNCIAPGAFESEMMDGMLERMGDISQHFPRKRIANPAQLDSTLLYLCSPASDAVTGTVIRVDDGQGSR